MGNFITMDKKTTILTLLRQGHSKRSICRLTHSSPKTVQELSRTLGQKEASAPEVLTGDLAQREAPGLEVLAGEPVRDPWGIEQATTEEVAPDPIPVLSTRSALLKPHLEAIGAYLKRGLGARRIWQDLTDLHGFLGGEDSVKRLVHKVKANHPKWFQHLDVLPGEEAQMDFLEGPRLVLREASGQVVRRRTWILVLTLSHSAMSYREAILDQSARTVLAALMRGFEKFGGVPERLKIDNFKAAVIQAHRYDPVLHPLFQAWAGHYGILLSPCDPGCPNQKGRVERDCRYTRDGFLKGLPEIDSLDSLNERLRIWEARTAHQRIHGRHKRQVLEVFQSEEAPALQPLPASPFHLFEMGRRKVSVQGTVEVDSCHYEVSHLLIGQIVSVQYDAREVRVYRLHESGPKFEIRHDRSLHKGHLVRKEGAHPAWMDRTRHEREAWYLRGASKVGPHCNALVESILSDDRGRHPRTHRRVLGIRDLERRFGSEILETACSKMTPAPEASWHRLRELCELVQAQRRKDTADSSPQADSTMTDPVIRSMDEYQEMIDALMGEVGQ
jgi:transposase